MKLPVTIFALGAMIIGGPALAQGSDRDVRCVVVSNIFAMTEKQPPKKQLAAAAGLYYQGRADARISAGQFKAAILVERKTLNKDNVGPAMTACAQAFIARQRVLKALGQELSAAPAKK